MEEKINYIQSCITAVSFPHDLEGLEKMIWKNKYDWCYPIKYHTDLDLLLYNDIIEKHNENNIYGEGDWTAPKWMTKGDILFYYYTSSSNYWSKRLLKESQNELINKDVLLNLKHAVDVADKYSGKILGCSEIAGTAKDCGFQDQHFKGRIFAPTKDVYIFKNPIDIKDFSEFVKINPAGTITSISQDENFQGLKTLLSKYNDLPKYLENAKIGDNVFYNVNKDNWKKISCSHNSTFLHEPQIRSYLIDYFLNEIKDYRTPLLEECDCFRNTSKRRTGTADYFIKLNSVWLPVEAKINILAENDIHKQMSKYMNINKFKPTKGKNRGNEYEIPTTKLGLVIDQSGVFTFFGDEFLDCNISEPRWRRDELPKTQEIRKNLERLINQYF